MEQETSILNVPVSVQINLTDGLMQPFSVHDVRRVTQLTEQFSDQAAVKNAISQGDPIVYEIYHHLFLTDKSDMAMGMSVISAGTVGKEYYMTKGHIHERDDQAEIYYCVQGIGLILLDDLQDDFQALPFSNGTAVHIPPQYAHRVVNTGSVPLIFVSAFHQAAGHAYDQVAKKGFAKIVIDENGKPELRSNPQRLNALSK